MLTNPQLTSIREISLMHHKRILIVDDDEIALMVLELSIEHLLPDCQIIATRNGAAALIELQKQTFDLIFTDYRMPQMNGLDLAQAIRQISPDIPPIILTTGGYSYDEIQTRAGSENLAGFLAKPFTLPQLREVLQQSGI
jgi:CheY-like chemotaxis protein